MCAPCHYNATAHTPTRTPSSVQRFKLFHSIFVSFRFKSKCLFRISAALLWRHVFGVRKSWTHAADPFSDVVTSLSFVAVVAVFAVVRLLYRECRAMRAGGWVLNVKEIIFWVGNFSFLSFAFRIIVRHNFVSISLMYLCARTPRRQQRRRRRRSIFFW